MLEDAELLALVSSRSDAHDVPAHIGSAALALAFAGRPDEAQRRLALLALDPRDTAQADRARRWQARLSIGVSRGELLDELRRKAADPASAKAWTLDLTRVLQQVELGHGLAAAERFIKAQQLQQTQQGGGASPSGGPAGRSQRP